MLTSLGYIFLVGLSLGGICRKLRLPRIVGMLFTGVVLGPYVLDLLDPSILSISAQLRQMALIIILLKAGLSLNPKDLKQVGRPAVLLSFVPVSCEILAFTLFAPWLLGVNRMEAALMGAVSPAVVVLGLSWFFEGMYARRQPVRNRMKVIVALGVSFLLMAVEEWGKATVQAAIGSVPLAVGLPCGQLILSAAVLAILITAPLGSLGMELTYGKCLSRENP